MTQLPQQLETKLLYETLGSSLIERSLQHPDLMIGQWDRVRRHPQPDGSTLLLCHNAGMPVTFEIVEHEDGTLEMKRERATFMWEPDFRHKEWLDVHDKLAWIDDIMFATLLPKDIAYGVTPDKLVRAEQTFTRILIQPIPRCWPLQMFCNYYIELDVVFENAGQNMRRFISGPVENFYDFSMEKDACERFLDGIGFARLPYPAPRSPKINLRADPPSFPRKIRGPTPLRVEDTTS